MKLFQITDLNTRKPIPGVFFADKFNAKQHRATLNHAAGHVQYYVSPGPDHWRRHAQHPTHLR